MLATLKTEENVSIITLDDGKVNAFSPAMIAEVDSLLDQVPTDKGAVMFTGREGMFTAGFDLKVMATDPDAAVGMIKSGFKMLQRIFFISKTGCICMFRSRNCNGCFFIV